MEGSGESGVRNDLQLLLRSLTLANATAFLALGALVLYVVGVVRTIGLLHAEGVTTARGVPLVPIQDYLLRGLGVVTDPGRLNGVLIVAAVLAFPLVLPDPDDEAATDDEHDEDAPGVPAPRPTWRARIRRIAVLAWTHPVMALALTATVIVGLLTPAAQWLPVVGAIGIIGAILWAAVHLELLPADPVRWRRPHRRAVTGVMLAVTLVMVLLAAYLRPPPIQRVRIELAPGSRPLVGKLLAVTDSLVYYLPMRRDRSDAPAIRAIPLGRVTALNVTDGPARRFLTIPQKLGLRLWHFDGDGNLRRDP